LQNKKKAEAEGNKRMQEQLALHMPQTVKATSTFDVRDRAW